MVQRLMLSLRPSQRKSASQPMKVIQTPETWLCDYPYWGEGWESKLQNWIPVRVQFMIRLC
jgi:hypothetical protein